jgi:hypothetical protein
MVDKCTDDGMVLPSIESFALGLKLPRVHFLFYEHIYKAVIGKGNWKQQIAENKRLGTAVSQTFGQTTLANNYMEWLLDYLQLHPTTTLLTEYDSTNNDDEDDYSNETEDTPDLFCGDLMEVEVSVAIPAMLNSSC